MKASIRINQSLIDFAMERTGEAQMAFKIAIGNGKCLTDEVVHGTELTLTSIVNTKVANMFDSLHQKPSSALTEADKDMCDELEGNPRENGVWVNHYDVRRIFGETFDKTFE